MRLRESRSSCAWRSSSLTLRPLIRYIGDGPTSGINSHVHETGTGPSTLCHRETRSGCSSPATTSSITRFTSARSDGATTTSQKTRPASSSCDVAPTSSWPARFSPSPRIRPSAKTMHSNAGVPSPIASSRSRCRPSSLLLRSFSIARPITAATSSIADDVSRSCGSWTSAPTVRPSCVIGVTARPAGWSSSATGRSSAPRYAPS